MNKKPNVLFLFCDQLNVKYLSCYGHKMIKTPNIDKLAERGCKFTNAYANNPICTPSRISFLSGLYPSTHGYYGLYGHEPGDQLTNIFNWLKNNGYRTGALGKLHTPRYWIEPDCQFIYDEFIEYPKYLEGAGLYDINDGRFYDGVKSGEYSKLPYEHSCEMALVKQARRFIRNEGEPHDRGKGEQPWFGWVSFARPHQPYTPSAPFASMYPPESIELPPTSMEEKNKILEMRGGVGEKHLRKCVSAYMGLVSQIDHSIGIIIEELENNNLLDNTIIILSADHGDYAGEHGLYSKVGGISYSAITKIPMIIVDPRRNNHLISDEIMESVDLFPTICDLLDITHPNTLQGKSYIDVLNGNKEKKIRNSALTENAYRKALATKEWRYVANIEGEEDELYDLVNDPWELDNKINAKRFQPIAGKMLRSLLRRVTTARRPINTINGFWHDHAYDLDGRIDLDSCGAINAQW